MQDCFDEVTDEVEAIFSGFNHKEARIHNKMGRASSKKHVIIFRINMKQSRQYGSCLCGSFFVDISAGSSAASVYRADEEKMQDCFDEVTDEVEAIFSGFNHKEARIHNKMGRASSKKTCYNIQDKYETVLYG